MHRIFLRTAAAAFLLLVSFLIRPHCVFAEIKLGILPRLNAVELFGMFGPLAEYLSGETGEKVSVVIPKDFDAFKNAVRAGQVDIGFCNSLVYVQLRKDIAIEPVALSSELNAGPLFRGVIIVRKDSAIQKISDLKGKKLIFVEKNSAGGFLFQELLLKKSGLNIAKDVELLPFAKKHDNVTLAVYNRAADAGGIREGDLAKMRTKVDLSKIRILAYSDYYPNWPMFAAPGMNAARTEKIKNALLKLKQGDPNAKRVLKAAGLDGFTAVSDKDYDTLRDAARTIGAF